LTDTTVDVSTGSKDTSFFGHPKGLAVLFFAEMWERFSYYGMRALLVLYLTQHFLFSDNEGQGIYAAYASLVYLMPIVGGFIADRYLGARRAVLIGAIFLTLGHFGMAFEGSGSKQFVEFDGVKQEIVAEGRDANRRLFVDYEGQRLSVQFNGVEVDGGVRQDINFVNQGASLESRDDDVTVRTLEGGDYKLSHEKQEFFVQMLFLSLALITVGVGFLKANISTIVGELYDVGDARRDSGFTIFYMGINLGSLLATILCGYLGAKYGWAYGFGLAGLGMLLGLITFIVGKPWLEGKGEPHVPVKFSWQAATWIGGAIALMPLWFLLQRDEIVSSALQIIAPLLFVGILVYSFVAFKGEVRSRMIVAVVLTVFSVIFWMLFEQAGSSLTLYASRNSELNIGPIQMSAGQTNFFNPAIIVLLAPVFAWGWQWLEKRGKNPSVPVKFSLGLMQVGLGFLVLVWGAGQFANETSVDGNSVVLVPMIWLILAYLLHTTGEICLSPVGLSMITKLSAPRLVGLMMGAWFLSSSLAHTLAGLIAQSTSSETVGGVVVDSQAQLDTYMSVFTNIGLLGVGVGVLLLILSPFLTKGMAGVK